MSLISTKSPAISKNSSKSSGLQKNATKDSTKISINSMVNPTVVDCTTRIMEGYVYDHYEPVAGKIIGIWVDSQDWWNINKINEYKTKWGFSHILGDDGFFKSCTDAGFPTKNIMMIVRPDDYTWKMDKYKQSVYAYFIPEPKDAGNDWNVALFETERNRLAQGIPLIMDGYKRTNAFIASVNYCQVVMFSSYHHWTNYDGIWWDYPWSDDQRPDWTDMRSIFGTTFSMSWISGSTDGDTGEIGDLVGHAANLGLTGIWYYRIGDSSDFSNNVHLAQFSENAWRNGYLRKFEVLHKYVYKCDLPDPCTTCNDPNKAAWTLISDTNLGQYREVYP